MLCYVMLIVNIIDENFNYCQQWIFHKSKSLMHYTLDIHLYAVDLLVFVHRIFLYILKAIINIFFIWLLNWETLTYGYTIVFTMKNNIYSSINIMWVRMCQALMKCRKGRTWLIWNAITGVRFTVNHMNYTVERWSIPITFIERDSVAFLWGSMLMSGLPLVLWSSQQYLPDASKETSTGHTFTYNTFTQTKVVFPVWRMERHTRQLGSPTSVRRCAHRPKYINQLLLATKWSTIASKYADKEKSLHWHYSTRFMETIVVHPLGL